MPACHAGRILNVIVCAADTKEPPRLLNYLTAPNCIIWSAVACSSAFPGLFKPQDLLALDRSGGYCRCVPPSSFPRPSQNRLSHQALMLSDVSEART